MEIRAILWAAATILVLALWLVSLSSAQEPVEATSVRGHFAYGDGVWRANEFSWFYYDLDEDLGGENLEIDLEDRTADKGHIVYSSKVWTEQFEFEPWGSYKALAFFGKLYFAGYPKNSFTEEVSSLEEGNLRMVLINDDRAQTLDYNRTLTLQQGYVLVPLAISAKKGTVNFLLLKNGDPIYASVVSIGDNFVYKVNDLPVILVRLTNAMVGGGQSLAEVEGIFQISDEPDLRIFDGINLGEMKLTDYSDSGIEFQNNRSITLKRDSTVSLIPNLDLIVLDDPDLVYYPQGWIFDYGMHEIRGPAFGSVPSVSHRIFGSIPSLSNRVGKNNSSIVARWNAENYSGFYFDPDKAIGGEELIIHSTEGRRIKPPIEYPSLLYTCNLQPREFEYKPWGDYYVISLLGTTWFAGYESGSGVHKSSRSLMENEYLGQVLMDMEPTGYIMAKNYTLQDGYEMRIRDMGNDSLFIQLLNDGELVDSSVVESNTTYEYKKDLENIEDMPIIRIHFGNIFRNDTQSFAAIDGIFQISDSVFPIEPGSGFGELELFYVMRDGLVFMNHDSISLNRNSRVNIGPGMDIRVADNDTLRYYLYSQTYVVPAPEPPLISTEKNVSSSQPANFSMIVRAAEIRQVLVNILDSSNKTVFSRDIAPMGQGSGEWWLYAWSWNATEMHMSDDNSPVPDMGEGPLLALLYLNQSASPLQVAVTFDPQGRISTIMDSNSAYYMSREDYGRLNRSLDYSSMINNSTARMEFFKVMPGESILQFFDLINNQFIPSGINHTLQGNLSALEPHAIASGAEPGRYQLQVRLENAVNAIWATDEYFNVADRYGFINDSISNRDSKISAVAAEGKSKKSPPMGILASILALTAAAFFRRRG